VICVVRDEFETSGAVEVWGLLLRTADCPSVVRRSSTVTADRKAGKHGEKYQKICSVPV